MSISTLRARVITLVEDTRHGSDISELGLERDAMAKNAIRGIVTSFRRGKRVQHTLNETIVEIGEGTELAPLLGAKASWTREGGLRMLGRVVGRHGGGGLRVRWRKGFPPDGLGTPVEIVVE